MIPCLSSIHTLRAAASAIRLPLAGCFDPPILRTMSSSTKPGQPTNRAVEVPRPSASLVVINDQNEILLVHRNPKARFFAGVHVFPGGNYDPKQDDSFAITAMRETFEEAGILLATSSKTSFPSVDVLEADRHAIHQQRKDFKSFLHEHQLSVNTQSLLPFTEWITPVNALRRFHTRFYVTFLSDAPSTGFSHGVKQDHIPKPDGGQEVVSARFVHPRKALEEFKQGLITFMPPQFYILSTLADIMHDSLHPQEQKQRIRTLSGGLFGKMVINPRVLVAGDNQGRTILTYEGDETRGGSKGRLHRTLVKAGKGGITSEITLLRNFDVFTEIEPHIFSRRATL